MIKYTPHTHAAISIVEQSEKIKLLYNELNELVVSLKELLPVGQLMVKYSQAKSKHDRMKDQINFLTNSINDLKQPGSSFSDESNELLLTNLQTQTAICNADTDKLFAQISEAEKANVSHTMNFQMNQIPMDSDLNQEDADDIVISYVGKMSDLNVSYEELYNILTEYNMSLKLLENEQNSYNEFKEQTNQTIEEIQGSIEERKNDILTQNEKIKKIRENEASLVTDFKERMKLLRDVSDMIFEKSAQSPDKNTLNAISELFMSLQNPSSKDEDVKLIVNSIIHLTNLKFSSQQSFTDEDSNKNKNCINKSVCLPQKSSPIATTPKNPLRSPQGPSVQERLAFLHKKIEENQSKYK